jgi:hypothetical protein
MFENSPAGTDLEREARLRVQARRKEAARFLELIPSIACTALSAGALLAFLLPFASVYPTIKQGKLEFAESEALTGWELVRGDKLTSDEDVLDGVRFWARTVFMVTAVAMALALIEAITGNQILRSVLFLCGAVVAVAFIGRVFTDWSYPILGFDPIPRYHSGFFLVVALSGSSLGAEVGMAGLRGYGWVWAVGMLVLAFMAMIMVLLGFAGLLAGWH